MAIFIGESIALRLENEGLYFKIYRGAFSKKAGELLILSKVYFGWEVIDGPSGTFVFVVS